MSGVLLTPTGDVIREVTGRILQCSRVLCPSCKKRCIDKD